MPRRPANSPQDDPSTLVEAVDSREDTGMTPGLENEDAVTVAIAVQPNDPDLASELADRAYRELEASTEDRPREAQLHHTLAVIAQAREANAHAALFHSQRSLEICPNNPTYLRFARQLYHGRRSWTLCVALIEAELNQETEAARRADLLVEMGDLLANQLASANKALPRYEQAVSTDPDNRLALHRLRALLLQMGAYQDWTDVQQRVIACTEDRRLRAHLHAELAAVRLNELGDVKKATESYIVAHSEDPTHEGVWATLRRLLERQERWGDLVELCLRQAEAVSTPQDKAECYAEAGRLCRDRLRQPERALQCLKLAVEQDDSSNALLVETAELLEAAGRQVELGDIHRRLLAEADPDEAAVLRIKLAVLQEQRSSHKAALAYYRDALDHDGGHGVVGRALRRLYRQAHQWEDLVQLTLATMRHLDSPQQKAICSAEAAQICEQRLDDLERAARLHQEALALNGAHEPSRRALERLFVKLGAHDDLLSLLEEQLTHQTIDERTETLHRMGMVCEGMVGEPLRAIGYYERALAERGSCKVALHALQRLYEQTEQYEQLVTVLTREADLLEEPDSFVSVALRAAELCERQLGRGEEATRRYEELLRRHPGRWVVIDSMAQSCERRGEWERLYKLLKDALEHNTVPECHHSAICLRLGELADSRLQQLDEAVVHYRHALSDGATHRRAFQALVRVYRRAGLFEALSQMVEEEIASSHGSIRANLCFTLGKLYQTELKRPEDASRCYRVAMESDPHHGAARVALVGLLTDAGRARDAATVIERGVEMAGDASTRRRLLKHLAALYESDLAEPREAIKCLERAADSAPEEAEVLCSLATMYEKVRDYPRLAAVNIRLAQFTSDVAERVRLLHSAARIAEVHPSEGNDAVALYQLVLQQSPDNAPAHAALRRLCGSQADPAAVEAMCHSLLTREGAPEDRADVLLRLAIGRETGGDLVGAEQALSEAVTSTQDWVLAHELRRLREQLGHWQGVVAALQREAELSLNANNAVELLLRVATMLQEQFSDADGAVSALRQVLEIDPFHDEAAQRLGQILGAREDWAELVDTARARLRRMAQIGQLPRGRVNQDRVDLLLRIARIERDELTQPLAAVDTLRELLAIDAHHVPASLLLAQIYESLEMWHEAVEAYTSLTRLTDDSSLLVQAHLQLGRLFQDRLGESGRAIASLQNVLVVDGGDASALHRLLDLFLAASDWDNAADVVSRLLEVEHDPAAQIELNLTLADVLEQGFGDPEAAVEQLEEAVETNPLGERVVDRLSQLHGRMGKPAEQCRVIAAHLEALPAGRQHEGIPRRMMLAQLLQRQKLVTDALAQYQAVVKLQPSHIDSRLEMARALRGQGDVAAAVSAYRGVLEVDPTHSTSLSELRSLWSQSGERDFAYASAAVLVCCGVASEADQHEYRQRRREGTRGAQVPIDDPMFESAIVHPEEPPAGRTLLAALGDVAHRIRPPDFDAWQVGRADRLSQRSDEPIKLLAQQVARVLGLRHDVGVYLSPTPVRRLDLLLTDPPALVVGGGVMASLSSREVRCWIADLLANVRSRCWVAHGCDAAGLAGLVQAATHAVDPGLRIGSCAQPEEVDRIGQQIKRGLNRRGRRALADAVSVVADVSQAIDYEKWVLAMRRTALRTALWVVNDLGVALNCLRFVDGQLAEASTPEEMGAAVRVHPLAADLVRFWMSDQFLAAQRASGTP